MTATIDNRLEIASYDKYKTLFESIAKELPDDTIITLRDFIPESIIVSLILRSEVRISLDIIQIDDQPIIGSLIARDIKSGIKSYLQRFQDAVDNTRQNRMSTS